MGNAKVGAHNELYNRAMGEHGSGIMNENRERLAEFCTTNNYVIGGTSTINLAFSKYERQKQLITS